MKNKCRQLIFLLFSSRRVDLFLEKQNCRNLSLIEWLWGREWSHKAQTLSGHSQLICWCWSESLGSTQATESGCFLKGLHLAVTSDVPVILHYCQKHLVPWCQADCSLYVIIVVEICNGFVRGYPGPFQSKQIKHKVSIYTSPVRAQANRGATLTRFRNQKCNFSCNAIGQS